MLYMAICRSNTVESFCSYALVKAFHKYTHTRAGKSLRMRSRSLSKKAEGYRRREHDQAVIIIITTSNKRRSLSFELFHCPFVPRQDFRATGTLLTYMQLYHGLSVDVFRSF